MNDDHDLVYRLGSIVNYASINSCYASHLFMPNSSFLIFECFHFHFNLPFGFCAVFMNLLLVMLCLQPLP